jgi:hypothetical protein
MLATVEQSHSTVLDVPTQTITLIYNSEADPGSQFAFDPPQPFLFIDEETTIIVTLQNATFADNPTTWISPSALGFPATPIGDNHNQLSIDITEPPPHYFTPWMLSFNVNVEGANGVSSPTLCLVRSPDASASTNVILQYAINTGIFTLASAGSLANLSILTNSITPFTVTFHLLAASTVKFSHPTPILGPSWLDPQLNTDFTQLTVSIPSTADKFTSLRFVLDVGTTQVTSPDPILVNATIGDG